MRSRASEHASRYRAEIELDVRSAATKFRDNDQEASVLLTPEIVVVEH